MTFNAAYTYSKAIDNASKLDGPEHVDAFNDKRERGLADFDVRTGWRLPRSGRFPVRTVTDSGTRLLAVGNSPT